MVLMSEGLMGDARMLIRISLGLRSAAGGTGASCSWSTRSGGPCSERTSALAVSVANPYRDAAEVARTLRANEPAALIAEAWAM
jgi:hypothetical protein